MTADGATVFCSANQPTGNHLELSRWTAAGGFQSLGLMPGGTEATPYSCSADGTVVGGQGDSTNGVQRAFRWTALTGLQDLFPPNSGSGTHVLGVSADGNTVVGNGPGGAFRWTTSTGTQLLFSSSQYSGSEATAVNADGSVISGDFGYGGWPFRWTPATGAVALQYYPSTAGTTTWGMNRSGSLIVGYAWGPNNPAQGLGPAMWDSLGAIRWLGPLPPIFLAPGARALSDDGSIILCSNTTAGVGTPRIWTASTGLTPLQSYLQFLGLDMTGWQVEVASAITGDGRTILGFGTFNNQANRSFLITLPGGSQNYQLDRWPPPSGDSWEIFNNSSQPTMETEDCWVANSFQAVDGANHITAISFRIGQAFSNQPVMAAIYTGSSLTDPAGLMRLGHSTTSATISGAANSVQTITLATPVDLHTGQVFYAAVLLRGVPGSVFPFTSDADRTNPGASPLPLGRSFFDVGASQGASYDLDNTSRVTVLGGSHPVVGIAQSASNLVLTATGTTSVLGACCNGSTCAITFAGDCSGPGMQFIATAAACNSAGATPCCRADFNHAGGVSAQDIFDFLTGWFALDPRADINGGGLSAQDIFDFLAAWFDGCP